MLPVQEPCAKKLCTKLSFASSQLSNPVPSASTSSSSKLISSSSSHGNPTLFPPAKIDSRQVKELQSISASNPAPLVPIPLPLTTQKATAPKNLLRIPTATGTVSVDISQVVNQAVQKGSIVSSEPRALTVTLGVHGRYIIIAQIDSNGPRVLSAKPLPPIVASSTATNRN